MPRGQFHDAGSVQDCEAMGEHHQRIGTLALGRCEGWLKVVGMTGGQRLQRYAKHRCSGFGFLHLQSRCRLLRVVEDADAIGLRECLAQHLKSFCG